MRRLLLAVAGAAVLFAIGAVPAFAHPLGNFTINHFSRVQVSGDRVRVHEVLDYAEIPAFQERQRGAGTPGYEDRLAGQVARDLRLTVDGRAERLVPRAHSLRFAPGQGGLEMMRFELDLEGPALPAGRHSVIYRDAYAPDRLGWREITVDASGGARFSASSVPAASVSDELRRYPDDRLANPLRIAEARLEVEPGAPAAPFAGPSAPLPDRVTRAVQDRFAALVTADQAPAAIALALLVAVLLGALHAIEPGHGKAVMAGYLVGTRGSARHAVLLALSITATHTAGVFLLGLVVLLAAQRLAPEQLYPWLSLLSGLLILGVGASLVVARLRDRAGAGQHHHDHAGDHHHHHAGRHHLHDRASAWSAVLLGISGGIVPCPSALVVLLAAVSLHRVAFGLTLIVAFSAGLALILTGVGLAVAGGRSTLLRLPRPRLPDLGRRAAGFAPLASAALVTLAGVAMTAQAVGAGR